MTSKDTADLLKLRHLMSMDIERQKAKLHGCWHIPDIVVPEVRGVPHERIRHCYRMIVRINSLLAKGRH